MDAERLDRWAMPDCRLIIGALPPSRNVASQPFSPGSYPRGGQRQRILPSIPAVSPRLSLLLSLSQFPSLSLSLIVCDGNAIAVCRVWVCVCVRARVSECLKQRGLVLFRQRRTDGGNLPTASPSAFLLIHIQRELQPCAAFYREAPSVSNHPAPLPSVTHTHTLAHTHQGFLSHRPPLATLTQHYKRRSASLTFGWNMKR